MRIPFSPLKHFAAKLNLPKVSSFQVTLAQRTAQGTKTITVQNNSVAGSSSKKIEVNRLVSLNRHTGDTFPGLTLLRGIGGISDAVRSDAIDHGGSMVHALHDVHSRHLSKAQR